MCWWFRATAKSCRDIQEVDALNASFPIYPVRQDNQNGLKME